MKQFARRFLRFSVLLLTACGTTYQKDHYEARQYIIQTTDTLPSNTELSKKLVKRRKHVFELLGRCAPVTGPFWGSNNFRVCPYLAVQLRDEVLPHLAITTQ